VDLDAGVEKLLEFLPAACVAAARCAWPLDVVDEKRSGPARQGRSQVGSCPRKARMGDACSREDLEPFEKLRGTRSAPGIHEPHDDIDAAVPQATTVFEQGAGLADPRCVAQEKLQPCSGSG
jgi:hypothetical protein